MQKTVSRNDFLKCTAMVGAAALLPSLESLAAITPEKKILKPA